MKSKYYLNTINLIIVLLITICALGIFNYKLQNKKLNFDNIKSHNASLNNNKLNKKIDYNIQVNKILNAEKFNLSVEDINFNSNRLNANLVYQKNIEDFLDDNKIKSFFMNNKFININNILLKENKITININCIV